MIHKELTHTHTHRQIDIHSHLMFPLPAINEKIPEGSPRPSQQAAWEGVTRTSWAGELFIKHRVPLWSSGSVLDHRSLPSVFETQHGHIWTSFHLWLRLITFGCHLVHLAYCVYKSGHKTSSSSLIKHISHIRLCGFVFGLNYLEIVLSLVINNSVYLFRCYSPIITFHKIKLLLCWKGEYQKLNAYTEDISMFNVNFNMHTCGWGTKM